MSNSPVSRHSGNVDSHENLSAADGAPSVGRVHDLGEVEIAPKLRESRKSLYTKLMWLLPAAISCMQTGGGGGGGSGGFVQPPGQDTIATGQDVVGTTDVQSGQDIASQPPYDGCTPKCGTKNCGPDGCGGVCGTCGGATPNCSATGTCISADCKPNCDGKACNDGCGGQCEGNTCDDNSVCTSGETCNGGICVAASALNCDDGNPCTINACSPIKGCVSGPNPGATCNDGNTCTTNDTCQGTTCLGGGTLACDDGDSCTTDSCQPKAGCVHTAVADLSDCSGGGVCVSGKCCVCGPGKSCNKLGLCVDENSCSGKCGSYFGGAKCQCDDQCGEFDDCCSDKVDVCTDCKPAASKFCCGTKACTANSCGKQDGDQDCPFGCDAKTGECKTDPCKGVPVDGTCFSPGMAMFCTVGTDDGESVPKIEYVECGKTEICDESLGFANCVQDPNACTPGEQKCAPGETNLAKVCTPGGEFKDVACAGCVETTLPGFVTCPGGVEVATVFGTAKFENVSPKAGYVGYDDANPAIYPVIYGYVLSIRYSDDFMKSQVLDAATTDASGKFFLKIPKVAKLANDFVILVAAGFDAGTKKFPFVVLKPDLSDGKFGIDDVAPLAGKPHSWSIKSSYFEDNDDWIISVDDGSWALQVYDAIRYTYFNAKNTLFGGPGKAVAVWVREGTDWSCGNCCWPVPTENNVLMGTSDALNQVFIGTSQKSYWSNAVLYHEFGHWLMNSFGTSPGEGGQHFVNSKVPPGMAWSEGWATFFSAMARGNQVYYDFGGGGMWWFDLTQTQYKDGSPLKPFSGTKILQNMDENRVAAALWSTAELGKEPLKVAGNSAYWKALGAAQMNDDAFTRGYFKQIPGKAVKGGPDGASYPDIKVTTTPAPMFADYLDALLCTAPNLAGKVKAAIGAYPFPVNNPICKP